MALFIDMDGVLADFDTHHLNIFGHRPDRNAPNWDVDWSKVRDHGNFFRGIPPMHDMEVLWSRVRHLNPTVLTGVPKQLTEEAAHNKRTWVAHHLGHEVPVITCLSREKCIHANQGDIIVDDWDKYRHLWIEKGGIWIIHISAKETIDILDRMGI